MSSSRHDNYRGSDERNGERRRRRSRSRSDSRDRKKQHQNSYKEDNKGRHGFESNTKNFVQETSPPPVYVNKANDSATIVIKGLPSHTTEPTLYAVLALYSPKEIRLIAQRDGECKGYAFVEFVSLEHAQYFMFTFAGSSGGDMNAAQFIVDNRAVLLEYARDGDRSSDSKDSGNPRYLGSRDAKKPYVPRSDWLCASCTCHNFAKRDVCFRCSASRTEHCQSVASSGGPGESAESVVSSETPSLYIAARGFSLFASEAQVTEVFRQFAVVRSMAMMKDPSVAYAKGLAFLEFHTVEHAAYVLQNAANIRIDAVPLKISYARESVMSQLIQQSLQPGSPLSLQPAISASNLAQQWSPYGAQQQQFVFGGYDAQGMPIMTDSSSAAYYQAYGQQQPMDPNQFAQHQQQLMDPSQFMQQQMLAATTSAKPKIRFPPHFETQGGGYVFQPKSGYFLEPVSEFYYCPRSKLYYSGRDGTYYRFDPSQDPPFKRFEPAAPTEPELSFPIAVSSTDVSPSATSVSVAPVPSGQLSGGALRTPLTLSLGGLGGFKGSLGKAGGTSSAVGKKVKNDLLKWGALQTNDEEEEEEENPQRSKGGKIQRAAPKAVSSFSAPGPLLTAAELSLLSKASPVEARVENRPTSVATGETTRAVVSESVVPPLAAAPTAVPPPASSGASSISSASTAGTSALVQQSAASVCLLCRRQFASVDMLRRHERESKLHADNLRQSLLDQVAVATESVPAPVDELASEDVASLPSALPASGSETATHIPPPPPPPPIYRNRALERRENQEPGAVDTSLSRTSDRDNGSNSTRDPGGRGFGDGGRGGGGLRGRGEPSPFHKPSVVQAPVAVFNDASNVGNTLLRKMGWTDGVGLGRDGTGREEAVGVELAAGGPRGVMHASAGPSTTNSLYQYKESSYKESLLSATRARFEQIAKK